MTNEATRAAIAPVSTTQSHNESTTVAESVDHEEIAALAYELWQRRGCPAESAECDWLEAEQELLGRTQEDQ